MVIEVIRFEDYLNNIGEIWFNGTFALPEGSNKLPDESIDFSIDDKGIIRLEATLDNEETLTDEEGNITENPNYDGRLTHGQAFVVEGHEGSYVLPEDWDLPQYPPERSEVYINVPFQYEGKDYRFLAGLYED